MTLVVGIASRESIWLMTDRRLTYGGGRPPYEAAVKMLSLETRDGVALLGYAGLGETAFGTEPGEWMARVLRGRNMPLEASLDVLGKAMTEHLPEHLHRLSTPGDDVGHTLVIPAFLERKPRFYRIDLVIRRSLQQSRRRFTMYTVEATGRILGDPGPAFMIGGSGISQLVADQTWLKPLAKIVKAHGRGRVTDMGVARHLAAINLRISKTDPTVGSSCVVAWRAVAGGGHRFFDGTTPTVNTSDVPAIALGIHLNDLFGVLWPRMLDRFKRRSADGEPAPRDDEEEARAISELPSEPDEDLK